MSSDKNKSGVDLRHRAEKQFKNSEKKVTSPGTHAQMQRLVYELEVHQIELELQNEELQQVRSELESYLAQYTDLYDFAPVGYFTLDINGLILQVNLTGVQMLGMERTELVNQHFSRLLLTPGLSLPLFWQKYLIVNPRKPLLLDCKKRGVKCFLRTLRPRSLKANGNAAP